MRQVERDLPGPVAAAEQVRDRQQMRHLQRFVAQHVGEANRAEGDVMDEPIGAPPASDYEGALYRVTYANGYVALLDAAGLRMAQMKAVSPARDEGTAIAHMERLQEERWVLHDSLREHIASHAEQDRSSRTEESPGVT